ncbi:PINIT domain-containing protein [Lentinula aciculospora]|uniref:PINIT domain-containing protein n=1 Tax=Lentinula aciculospora TaxID=153920 RepID=A0A9W9AM16_9AGAR|nr:PINIT domain-containing protein [Lentinula aciculospora]
MAANDPWSDFEALRHNVRHNTVDRLKQILGGFNDECGTHFSKSGKKQEIIERIVSTIDSWKQANNFEKWAKAKQVLYQVRNSGTYTVTRPSSLHSASMSSSSYAPSSSPMSKLVGYSIPSASSSANNYNKPYISNKLPAPLNSSGLPPAYRPSNTSNNSKPELRFKDSPFFRIHETISSVVECPESQNGSDRKQAVASFTLNQDQINRLTAPNSQFRIRLFCTSSSFYTHPSYRANMCDCPIEFPTTCEVRVNGKAISANLKGLKKKPGTAPPPVLDELVNYNTSPNRVEMIYVNSQQPPQPKKFFLVVKLVETTSVTSLVDNLKKNCFESSEKIQKQMQASTLEDDDIVAGPQKMSLRCPLTLARINTPCRSSKCVHVQCFDATSWFSVNEQTTTWLCPVCERTLEVNDLVIDGYVESILKDCSDGVEDVMVEADGEWHTSDDKFGSPNWKIKHPPKQSAPPSRKPPPLSKPTLANGNTASSIMGPNGAPKKFDILTIEDSDDDEDEGRVKRELSPSFGNMSSASDSQPSASTSRPQLGDVIDLTIDSDDDDSPPPPPSNASKRKAPETNSPTEIIWKKAKTNGFAPLENSPPLVDSDEYSRIAQNGSHPSVSLTASPSIHLSSYNQSSASASSTTPSLPSFYASFSGRPPSTNGANQLPPINGYSSSRQLGSSASRWG